MTLRVSGKNMDVGEALRTRAEERCNDVVSKYFDRGYEGHLTFEHEGSGFRSDMVLHLDSGVILRAHAQAGDAVSAFETTTGHIEKRLRRYKRKLKSHRRKAEPAEFTAQSYVLASPDSQEEVEENFSPPVIAESAADLHRMSVGEAVMELDLSQADVKVFINAGHGGVNVVYRRADGNIGWVDPTLLQK
ncbi:MAG TPA: ribosome-associated translation inhibitor RaiA [Devosia sp.]|nr:ribosome-associated translation inhibitor RaiA [Devosia sp.]